MKKTGERVKCLCIFAFLWFICILVSPAPALAQKPTGQTDQPRSVTEDLSGSGVVTGDSPAIVILGNEIYANHISAINIQGNRVSVEKCRIYQNGNAGIVVDNDAHAWIRNNQIYSQQGAGITVMGAGSAQVSILGNQIHQNKMTGLQLGAKDQIEVPVHESFKKNPTTIFARRGDKINGGDKIKGGVKIKGEDSKSRGGDKGTGTGGQGDKGIGEQRDQGTGGAGGNGTGGPGEKGTGEQRDQGTGGLKAQRTGGPGAQAKDENKVKAEGNAEGRDRTKGHFIITVDMQNNRIYRNGESGIKCQPEYPQHSISLTAEHNAIFQNQKGGILVANTAKVALRHNSIYENHKAGVSANKSKGTIPQMDIYQNIIRGNEESGIDLTCACSGPIGVCNNLIFNNGGSGIRFGAPAMRIVNNTIVSNGNLSKGSGIDQQEKNISFIANNILAYNFKTGLNMKKQKGCSYNLFFANGGSGTCCDDCYFASKFIENKELGGHARSTGDMICDPAFSNPDLFDFRLKKWSPAIDAGIPSPEFEDLHFPPCQGGRKNDLGVTGGPMAVPLDPNALIP
jgi:hypothetical protein